MVLSQIENNVAKLIKNFSKDTFIFDLLLAYGLPKATITRLVKGASNLSKVEGEVSLKKKLFFKEVYDKDLHLSITELAEGLKHNQRFVIVTDYSTLLAKDTQIDKFLDIQIKDLPKNFDFFLPWAGMEKAQLQNENPADIKAAMKMGKLFEDIKGHNNDDSLEFKKDLNVFLSRLLFCFFAEDAEIFEENLFSNSISSHTQENGSDFSIYLERLFQVLNTKENERVNIPDYLNKFPYVNGGLFAVSHKTPKLSGSIRKAIIEAGTLDWANINPDIFGSMFQAVNYADSRGTLGQHFTSVPNIIKVIEPLFLNDLKEEFENSKGNNKKLSQLLNRLKNIKIFDPACGSGNFLIIAYKELRRLEMEIFKEMGSLALSEISLSHFYGIEIDEFAKEIAILALWLAKHQMNVEFFKEFGRTNPTLPLTDTGNILQGNACRLDWEKVCPKVKDDEIYVLGNPPYLGAKLQNVIQKEDVKLLFKGYKKYNNLDYIACWFYKASLYLTSKIKVAFVSTNSICQGTQVFDLWPNIFKLNIEIGFAVKDFIWSNNAKNKATVMCSIIGLRIIESKPKYIHSEGILKEVENINGYLLNSANIFIEKRTSPLSNLPKMIQGNIALDNGFLQLTAEEKDVLISQYPNSKVLVRKIYGSRELINDMERYCLWISNDKLNLAMSIKPIRERIENIRAIRLKGATNAKSCADRPHQFCMTNTAKNSQIILPIVSSERRDYIPMAYKDKSAIVTHAAQVILDAELYVFSILNSKMQMIWVRSLAGKLEMRFRYSAGICWYSFPFPNISKHRKEELTQSALNIIDERLKYSEKTLSELYDPDKMPEGLREAHHQNDLAVERCYRSNPFSSDEERLEYLFKLYETMIKEEKDSGTLFAKEKKTRKRR